MVDSITLAAVDRDHLPKLRFWRNDPRISLWCRQSTFISDVEQERWFERQSVDPSIQMFSIYRGGSTHIGCAGFTSIDRLNQRAEFSLYIGPEFHGNGYGKAALQVLFKHGFKNLNLNLIWGECFQGNSAVSIFSDIGMKTEGVRRQFYFKEGKYIDATLVSMTRAEWEEACLRW